MIDFVNDVQTFTPAQQLLLVDQAIANLMVYKTSSSPNGVSIGRESLGELRKWREQIVTEIASAAGTGRGMGVLLARFGNPR